MYKRRLEQLEQELPTDTGYISSFLKRIAIGLLITVPFVAGCEKSAEKIEKPPAITREHISKDGTKLKIIYPKEFAEGKEAKIRVEIENKKSENTMLYIRHEKPENEFLSLTRTSLYDKHSTAMSPPPSDIVKIAGIDRYRGKNGKISEYSDFTDVDFEGEVDGFVSNPIKYGKGKIGYVADNLVEGITLWEETLKGKTPPFYIDSEGNMQSCLTPSIITDNEKDFDEYIFEIRVVPNGDTKLQISAYTFDSSENIIDPRPQISNRFDDTIPIDVGISPEKQRLLDEYSQEKKGVGGSFPIKVKDSNGKKVNKPVNPWWIVPGQ